MEVKKTVLGAIIGTTVLAGGVGIADLSTNSLVKTLYTPIGLQEIIKFGVSPHTVDIKDNGEIDIKVNDKTYALTPKTSEFDTKEKSENKRLFLSFETSSTTSNIKDVWGDGSDIEIKNTSKSVSKIVSFSKDFIGKIPDDAKYIEVSFDLAGDWDVPNGIYTNRFEVDKSVWLEKSLAWDSSVGDPDNDIPNGNYTDIEVEIKDGILTKKIPVEWLKNATYPVYTDAVFTFGTKQLLDTGVIGTMDVLPIGADKAAICWNDNADATQEGQCVITTVSGTTLTFGAVSDFVSDTTGGNNGAQGACAAGNDRWVVTYVEDLTEDATFARVGSSTGTVINGYGTAASITGTSSSPTCVQVDTDTVVFAYGDNAGGGGTARLAKARACTINTDYTLTCGGVVPISGTTTVGISNDFSCAKANTNKFICKYKFGTADFAQTLVAGTVSGTTITAGGTTTIQKNSSVGLDDFGHSIISPTTDKFAVYWNLGGPGAAPQGFALGSLSGTTITLGATTTLIISTTTSFASLNEIDANRSMLFYQQGATDAGTTFTAIIPIQMNFSTLTFTTSTAEQVDATTDPGSLHAAKISACKFLFAWEDDNDTNDLFAIIGDIFCRTSDDTLFEVYDE